MRFSSVIRFVLVLTKLRNWMRIRSFILVSEQTRGFDSSLDISWSQGEEKLSILSLFSTLGLGTYVNIGCHHPSRYSNTRHLYQAGWRGVNIDTDEALMTAFFSERPEDVNICAAVGLETQYVPNVFDEKLVSTVDSSGVDYEVSIGRKRVSEITVRGITLRSIIDSYFPEERVTVLLIDIKGSDFDALKSLDVDTLEPGRFPKYLVLETFPPLNAALSAPAVKLEESKGYKPLLVLPPFDNIKRTGYCLK